MICHTRVCFDRGGLYVLVTGSMLTLAVALFFLFLSPGPGVLSLAGVGSAYGYRAGWAYGIGLFVGSNSVMIMAAAGLAAALVANAHFRIVFTVLSTTYLLFLAMKIALAGSKVSFVEATRAPGIMGGIGLQVINPKAYAVGVFVFSNFPIWPENLFVEICLKLLLLNAIWIPIHALWLAAGVTINRLELSQTLQRSINLAMAGAMLLVVGLALWSTLSGGDGVQLAG